MTYPLFGTALLISCLCLFCFRRIKEQLLYVFCLVVSIFKYV